MADPQSLAMTVDTAAAGISNSSTEPQNITTADELEAFHMVRAILRGVLASKRITMRDAQSYCAVLLDDNNRKPICRLRFNNGQKLRLGIFNNKKEEELFDIESVDDIYNYTEQLKTTASSYLAAPNVE